MTTSSTDGTRKIQADRRSRGRPTVPPERIVATALAIVDEQGADALSMRALALRLDSGTATLYRHFADRNDLIAHIIDRVFGEVQRDAAELDLMSWQESCRAAAIAMFDALSQHRNVAPLLVEIVPLGPNAMRVRERCISMLLDNGFATELAARSWAALAHYVLGFAIQINTRASSSQVNAERLSAIFHGLDESQFPGTVAVADAMPVPLEDEFAFGLDLILTGLSQVHGADR